MLCSCNISISLYNTTESWRMWDEMSVCCWSSTLSRLVLLFDLIVGFIYSVRLIFFSSCTFLSVQTNYFVWQRSAFSSLSLWMDYCCAVVFRFASYCAFWPSNLILPNTLKICTSLLFQPKMNDTYRNLVSVHSISGFLHLFLFGVSLNVMNGLYNAGSKLKCDGWLAFNSSYFQSNPNHLVCYFHSVYLVIFHRVKNFWKKSVYFCIFSNILVMLHSIAWQRWFMCTFRPNLIVLNFWNVVEKSSSKWKRRRKRQSRQAAIM